MASQWEQQQGGYGSRHSGGGYGPGYGNGAYGHYGQHYDGQHRGGSYAPQHQQPHGGPALPQESVDADRKAYEEYYAKLSPEEQQRIWDDYHQRSSLQHAPHQYYSHQYHQYPGYGSYYGQQAHYDAGQHQWQAPAPAGQPPDDPAKDPREGANGAKRISETPGEHSNGRTTTLDRRDTEPNDNRDRRASLRHDRPASPSRDPPASPRLDLQTTPKRNIQASPKRARRTSPKRSRESSRPGPPAPMPPAPAPQAEPQTSSQEAGNKNRGWPESFKRFVERVMTCAEAGGVQEHQENWLKGLLAETLSQNVLYTTDWDRRSIPSAGEIRGGFVGNQHDATASANQPGLDPQPGPLEGKLFRRKRRRELHALPTDDGEEDLAVGTAGNTGWGNLSRAETGWGNSSAASVGFRDGARGWRSEDWPPLTNTSTASIPAQLNARPGQSSPARAIGANGKRLSKAEQRAREKRAARFAQADAEDALKSDGLPAGRFDPYAAAKQERHIKRVLRRAHARGEEVDLSKFTVKGTSTSLEKKYLRLTGVPDPATVRPEPVLKASLSMVQDRWARSAANTNRSVAPEEAEQPGVTYLWVCEQLKAIRQDLTVQHIKNEFAAEVYQIHARIALQEKDLGEFNQCQTQAKELFDEADVGTLAAREEFAGYHVLYLLFIQLKYGLPSGDLAAVLASMDESTRGSVNVRHALAVRSAIEQGLHTRFFKRLVPLAPGLGRCFLDLMVDYVRYESIKVACMAYRPSLSLESLQREFCHLDLSREEDTKSWESLVSDNPKVVLAKGDTALDTKLSYSAFAPRFQWPVLGGDSVQRAD